MLGSGLGLVKILFRLLSRAYSHVARRKFNSLLWTDRSDSHAGELKTLAESHMADHAVSHKRESLEEAISIYEQLLQLRPVGHERRAEAVADLANALFHLCAEHGTDDIRAHRCVELLREDVQLRSANHPLRHRSLHNLARALFFIYYEQRSGDLAVLTECILLNREALQLRTVGHPERVNSLGNLAATLMRSFERCGDPTLLEEGISMSRQVMQLLELKHPLRGISLNNLAIALAQFGALHGSLETLAEADSLLRELLELRPAGHPLRYQALDNLAGLLHSRFDIQALPAVLSEAIVLRREAFELMSASHPAYGYILSNLAWSLVTEFGSRRDVSSITEAIVLLRRALLLRPLEDHNRSSSLDSLAEALLLHFNEYGDPEYLQEAIKLHREVLILCPRGNTRRPGFLQKLGRLLCKPEVGYWSEALALFQEALEGCPVGHPSRSSLLWNISHCFLDPASPYFDLSAGLSLLTESYSDEFSHVNQRVGRAVSDLQKVETAYIESKRDAEAPTRDHYSDRILDLHAQVIGLLPRAANFGLDHKTRLQVITGSDEIARNAVARALLLQRTAQAVELLEEGRGIFWSQALHLRATGFNNIPDSDREDLLRLLNMLAHEARTTESSANTAAQREEASEMRRRLNVEAETLISKIRAYPGCTRFLRPAAFESLLNGLPDGYVVILNASKLGHHALILHRVTGLASSMKLELPSTRFDFAALRARLPRDMDLEPVQQDELHPRAMRLDSGRCYTFEDALSLLWTFMVRPVIRKLGLQEAVGHDRPRLWWCVTGELGFLPIHAAGQCGSARHLPGAEKEACLVRECFGAVHARVLNSHSPHASIANLRTLLQKSPAHILHLACHGVQDADPLSSALVMQDGKLTIEDMLQLDMPHAVLAYLSACQTAKGDQNAPDQAVHLAASMLFCGFRSVVGTMWLMHDEDGPKLARWFYEALFRQEALSLDDIAYALDEAVQDLRNQGVPAQRWALFMHMGG